MEKEEIEKILAQAKSNDPDVYATFKGKAFQYVEELAAALAEKDRQLNQVSVNFKFLMDIIDAIHFDLFQDKSGTWQARAQQSTAEVRRIKGDIAKIRQTLDTTEKTCILTHYTAQQYADLSAQLKAAQEENNGLRKMITVVLDLDDIEERRKALFRGELTKKSECHWDEDSDGTWATDCKNIFQFFDGGPTDNEFNFCSYCGGRLIERKYKEKEFGNLARGRDKGEES